MERKIVTLDNLEYYNDKISNYVDEKVSNTVDNLELNELNAILVDTYSTADDPIIPDYITETELEAALSGKMDKVTLATVATSGSYNDLSNKPSIPDLNYPIITHEYEAPGFPLQPNTYHKFLNSVPTTLTLASPTDDSIVNEYVFEFIGTEDPLILPSTIIWMDDNHPVITVGKTYVVSILNNLAIFGEF